MQVQVDQLGSYDVWVRSHITWATQLTLLRII